MTTAPAFSLPDETGRTRSLADYLGHWLILYFYPQDDTPGCTTEACAFRDAAPDLTSAGDVTVVGISTDSVESHRRFAAKYNLTFTLLSDPSHAVIEAYESWKPSGPNRPAGTARNTFIIDPTGRIVKTYRGVDPNSHISEILADLATLKPA
jgi:peroxiredoxin Q/BCP